MSDLAIIQKSIETDLVAAGVQSVLPDSVKMSTFVRCAAVAMASNKDLGEADRDSVIMALTQCATDGLIPDSKEAAIVTFNTKIKTPGQPDQWIKKAQYLPMIDGVIKRARLSGQIASMSSKAVYDNDEFSYWMDEHGEHYKYVPVFINRGNLKLFFSYARLINGELLIEVMTMDDIEKVKKASKTSSYGPWIEWLDRMGCKSVTHRLARRLPNASEIVEMCEQGMNMNFDARTEKEIIPKVEDPISRLKYLLKDKNPDEYLPWLHTKSIDDMTSANASAAVLKLENSQQ